MALLIGQCIPQMSPNSLVSIQSNNYLSENVSFQEAMLIISNIPAFSELDLGNNIFTSAHRTGRGVCLDSILLECLVNSFRHNTDILPTRQIRMEKRNLFLCFKMGGDRKIRNNVTVFQSYSSNREVRD